MKYCGIITLQRVEVSSLKYGMMITRDSIPEKNLIGTVIFRGMTVVEFTWMMVYTPTPVVQNLYGKILGNAPMIGELGQTVNLVALPE